MASPSNENPYASPKSEEEPLGDDFSDKRLLILPPKSVLPTRCVFCNRAAPNSNRLHHSWWLYFWGVFDITIRWHACDEHQVQVDWQQRRSWVYMIPAFFLLGLTTLESLTPGFSGFFDSWWPALVAALVAFPVVNRIAYWKNQSRELALPKVIRAEPDAICLKHAGKPFLDSLADGAEGFLVVDKIP